MRSRTVPVPIGRMSRLLLGAWLLAGPGARGTGCAQAVAREFPGLEESRVRRIADWLEAEPGAPGRPASDREAWESLMRRPAAAQIIGRAEENLAVPPPDLPDELYLEFSRTGNRRNYERPYEERMARIRGFLLAECLEARGRFLPALEREILAVCGERSWTMPAHDRDLTNFHGRRLSVDLGSSARAWLLALADGWMGDRLDPEVRAVIRREVGRRVLDPYRKVLQTGIFWRHAWMVCGGNWNPVCTAGVTGAALALVEDPLERARFLAAMEISASRYLAGFGDDGYCDEGIGYWNYGFGRFLMLGLTVREATQGRLDIFQDPRLPRIAAYARGYQIQPGRAPFFTDGGGAPSPMVWALLLQVVPEAVPADFRAPDLLHGDAQAVALRAFGREPVRDRADEDRLPPHTWYPNGQVLVTRSDPDAGPPFGAAVKGGHNAERHNHNDVGTYSVVYDGVEMLGDPGGVIYTAQTFGPDRYLSPMLNSFGHPVPVVAGRLQRTGREAAARVVSVDTAPEGDRIEFDLRAAYDASALAGLNRVFRHDRNARFLEIEDRVRWDSPRSFSSPLITYRRVLRAGEDLLYLFDDRRCVEVRIAVEGGGWSLEEEWIENPGLPSPRRLAVTMNEPVEHAVIRFRISPVEPFPDGILQGLVFREPEWGALRPDAGRAIPRRAGEIFREQGGEVEIGDKSGAAGPAIRFWDNPGHVIEYRLHVPEAGLFALQLRYCAAPSANPIVRRIRINGEPLGPTGRFVFPDTGGWSTDRDDWREIYAANDGVPALVELEAGEQVLSLVNECGHGLNLEVLRLVPVSRP